MHISFGLKSGLQDSKRPRPEVFRIARLFSNKTILLPTEDHFTGDLRVEIKTTVEIPILTDRNIHHFSFTY